MSELKTYKMVDEKYCTDCVCVIPSEVYIKSEADEVIEKLKDSLNKLQKARTEQLIQEVIQKTLIYGDGFVPVEHAIKLVAEIRHNKYKRCINMVDQCGQAVSRYLAEGRLYEINSITAEGELHDELLEQVKDCDRKVTFYDRWYRRWSEIVEEYK